jgi:cytochrome c-type biogenesis protein CcmH/NrfG
MRSPHDVRDILGMAPDAPTEEVEAVRAGVETFLEDAPADLASWVTYQRATLDAAPIAEPAQEYPGDAADAGEGELDDVLCEDEDEADEPRRPGPRADHDVSARRRSPLVLLAAVVLVAAIVYAIYRVGAGSTALDDTATSPDMSRGMSSQPAADPELIAELEAALAEDPDDVEAMDELATAYSAAADYDSAVLWRQEIVARDPDDADARLALGVALFNAGDLDGAEEQWATVVEFAPDRPEGYFDLGFLYLSRDPADPAAAQEAWAKVVELAPDSDLAQVVETHLTGLSDMIDGTTDGATGDD